MNLSSQYANDTNQLYRTGTTSSLYVIVKLSFYDFSVPNSFNVVLGLPLALQLCNDTPSLLTTRRQCYLNFLSTRSSTPQAIGEAIAADAAFRFLDDGNNWNAKGAPGCQGQFCYPYEDTTGYQAGQGDLCEAMKSNLF